MGYAMALFDYMKPKITKAFILKQYLLVQWKGYVWIGEYASMCRSILETANYCHASKLNIAVARVTPPDENGFMCRSNFASFLDLETIRNADYVIVEVNRYMPRLVAPEFKIHVSEVDKIIEHHEPF
jgi:acyl-CoA hydrolase